MFNGYLCVCMSETYNKRKAGERNRGLCNKAHR